MDDFCSKCDNLLSYMSNASGTIKVCRICGIPTPIKPEDSLRYSVS